MIDLASHDLQPDNTAANHRPLPARLPSRKHKSIHRQSRPEPQQRGVVRTGASEIRRPHSCRDARKRAIMNSGRITDTHSVVLTLGLSWSRRVQTDSGAVREGAGFNGSTLWPWLDLVVAQWWRRSVSRHEVDCTGFWYRGCTFNRQDAVPMICSTQPTISTPAHS